MKCINYTDVLFVTIMLLNKSISWYSERSQTLDVNQGIIYCGIESPEGLIVSCVSSDFEPILSQNGVEKIDTEKEHEILAIKEIKKRFLSLFKKDAAVHPQKENLRDSIAARHETYNSKECLFERERTNIINSFIENPEEDTFRFIYHKHTHSEEFIDNINSFLKDEGFYFVVEHKPTYHEFIVSIYPIKGYVRIIN